jgi:hypothetical protein
MHRCFSHTISKQIITIANYYAGPLHAAATSSWLTHSAWERQENLPQKFINKFWHACHMQIEYKRSKIIRKKTVWWSIFFLCSLIIRYIIPSALNICGTFRQNINKNMLRLIKPAVSILSWRKYYKQIWKNVCSHGHEGYLAHSSIHSLTAS